MRLVLAGFVLNVVFIAAAYSHAQQTKYRVGQPLDKIQADLEQITPIGSSTDFVLSELKKFAVQRPYALDSRNGVLVRGEDGRDFTKKIGEQSITVFLDTKAHVPLGGTHLIAQWAFSPEGKLLGVYLHEISE